MILKFTSWILKTLRGTLLHKTFLYIFPQSTDGGNGNEYSNKGRYSVSLKIGDKSFKLLFDQKPSELLLATATRKIFRGSSLLSKGSYTLNVGQEGRLKVK